jgi:hypothetical protein
MPTTDALITKQSEVHPTTCVSLQGHENQSDMNDNHPGKKIQPPKVRLGSFDRMSLCSRFGRGLAVSRKTNFRSADPPLDDCVASIRNKMDATSNVRLSVNEVRQLLHLQHGMASPATALYMEWDTTSSTVHDETMQDAASLVHSVRTLSSLNVYRSIMEIRSVSDTNWDGAQYRPWDTVPLMTVSKS